MKIKLTSTDTTVQFNNIIYPKDTLVLETINDDTVIVRNIYNDKIIVSERWVNFIDSEGVEYSDYSTFLTAINTGVFTITSEVVQPVEPLR